jgi:outer membrane receptor for ferrienterochelin and colicins
MKWILCIWALAAAPWAAAEAPAGPAAATSEQEEAASLMAILNEETAVATRTKTNADFVPGIVTVLAGDEMEALGFETVGEALALVPGMQGIRTREGTPSIVVRGIDFPFNNGNVKVMIDSVPLSRENAGINAIVLMMPIQQVDRIEIIRGPGSVVYGDFAFMGLVNIVTRSEGRRIVGRFGADGALSGGGYYNWKDKTGKWRVSVGAAGLTNDDTPVDVPSMAEEQRGFGVVTIARGGLSLIGQVIARDVDPSSPPPIRQNQKHWAGEARYVHDFSKVLHAELHVEHLDNHFDGVPNTFDGPLSGGGFDVTWTGWSHHSWLVSTSYSSEKTDRATALLPPPPGGTAPPPLAIVDKTREVAGVALQDQIDLSSAVALTVGARYDHYSDVDSRLTPRVSLAWRINDQNILKGQYAEGFRAPNFFELYARGGTHNDDLGFEVNGTSELNFVHRRPRTVVRATAFHTKIRDMIFVRPPQPGISPVPTFVNGFAHARAYGAELELEQELGRTVKAQANVSWVDAVDNRVFGNPADRVPPPAADWLANAVLLWHPRPRTLVGGRWSFVGHRHGVTAVSSDNVLDATLTQNDVLADGLQIRAGVRNIFDHDPRYVFASPVGADSVATFPGRTFFVQAAFSR